MNRVAVTLIRADNNIKKWGSSILVEVSEEKTN